MARIVLCVLTWWLFSVQAAAHELHSPSMLAWSWNLEEVEPEYDFNLSKTDDDVPDYIDELRELMQPELPLGEACRMRLRLKPALEVVCRF